MYCAACGTQLAPGLSYCNRCGVNLKERSEPEKVGPIPAFLTAITIIGVGGLGLMLGGTLALNGAGLDQALVGFFMLFTFLIVGITEILLVRQLSRFTAGSERKQIEQRPPLALPQEFQQPRTLGEPRALAEPISSVTENTTRTLEYSRNEPAR